MAPLSQALSPRLVESGKHDARSKYVYGGTVDPDWVVGSIPHGGYVLGLLVAASMKCQKGTKHKDPIHVTAHFMQPTARTEYRVEVEVIRTGSRFSNLTANLVQDGETKVLTHMIFGTLPPFDAPPSANKHENIAPTHPLYKPIPLVSHPQSTSSEELQYKYGRFRKYVRRAEDYALRVRNKFKLTAPPGTHDGGLESGAWWEVMEDEGGIELSMMPFFADIFENTPALLSEAHGDGTMFMWYPTMVMTLEFKRQLPPRGAPGVSNRTLGVYSKGSFLEHGRHDIYGEVWSSPSNIGEGDGRDASDESWRRDMRCVAVTGQMALSVPLAINKSKGEKKAKL
ncbi:thioesterase family protein [Ceratobasidium sp. AG-Ba]|nr:thioesterase family protein [Ceratobasidium sp. AG-Ba]QRW06871.1 thioesterase family protein [Ceratobasidium sp. AG-Ba]